MKPEIKRDAERLFINHPEVTTLYGTDDGNLFYQENLARQHAKIIGSEHFAIERPKDLPKFEKPKEKMPVASNKPEETMKPVAENATPETQAKSSGKKKSSPPAKKKTRK